MGPRMLDKINSLNSLRSQRERCQEEIDSTMTELLDEIKEIAVRAGIPGYHLIKIGNTMQSPF